MKKLMAWVLAASMAVCLTAVSADEAATAPQGVYRKTTDMPLDLAYRAVYGALEAEKFWVVFEADMGQRMAKMRDRWGDAYNQSELTGVKSMVFCNIDWTHRIANANPDLLALCPLHLSLYSRAGQTVLVMPRPGVMAAGSQGQAVAQALEDELRAIVDGALETL